MSATLHSRYVKNRNLVYYAGHRKRLIDAVGPDVVKYVEDFTGGPSTDAGFDAVTEWTITRVEAGAGESTLTRIDASGGFARITTDAAENDGINAQLFGESFELTSDQAELYVGMFGVTVSDVTQSDLFLGLAVTDTDILGNVTDSVGFRKVDASAVLSFMTEKDSTETTGTATTLTTAATDLEFHFTGATGAVEFFVNGVSVGTSSTNVPNDELLRLSWHFLTGEAVAKTCDIDKLVVIQVGR